MKRVCHANGTSISTNAAVVQHTAAPKAPTPPAKAPEPSVLSMAVGHGSGSDLVYTVAAFLGWRDLLALGATSTFFGPIARSDNLWRPLCEDYWRDKVFLPASARKLTAAGEHRQAFADAYTDAKRTWITAEELCSMEWHSRMKAAAGDHYTDTDPWWTGSAPPRRSKYNLDGTTTRLVVSEDGQTQNRSGKWRFVRSSCGMTGPLGSFVRMQHSALGRETPTKVVRRHKNWGWLMDGCWSVSASFPLPPKGEDPSMEDEGLEITVERQQEEAMAFNYGLPMPDEEPVGGGAEGGGAEGGGGGGAEGGGGGGGGGSEGGGGRQLVTIEIDGREVVLPVEILLSMIQQQQQQLDSSSESGDSDYGLEEGSDEEEGGGLAALLAPAQQEQQQEDDDDEPQAAQAAAEPQDGSGQQPPVAIAQAAEEPTAAAAASGGEPSGATSETFPEVH